MCFKSSFTIPAVVAMSFCLIGGIVPAPAYADLGDQLFKLLPNDGAGGDLFGWSIAIDNGVVAVGAYHDNDNGTDSGSAYLFDAAHCPADLDNSGDVGVKDLLILLGAWGPCPPKGNCPADFDDSGDVGVKDLLFLLGNWGLCP